MTFQSLLRNQFALAALAFVLSHSANANTAFISGPAGTITSLDVEAEIANAPDLTKQSIRSRPNSVAQVARNLYVRRGFAKMAEEQSLHKDPGVAAELAQAKEKILSEALLKKMEAANTPSESAALEWARTTYKVNPKRFETGKQVRTSHILILGNAPNARRIAEDTLAEVKANPAKFEELAKERSADQGSAANGGDVGFFGEGRMVKPFEDAAFALEMKGDVSDLVVTQFGFHIIKLTDTRPAGIRTFDEVKDGLVREAIQKLKNQFRTSETEQLLRDAAVDTQAIETFSASQKD